MEGRIEHPDPVLDESAPFTARQKLAFPERISAEILKDFEFLRPPKVTDKLLLPTPTVLRLPPFSLLVLFDSLGVIPDFKMAKDKVEKKDKREKKEKRSEKEGVHKSKKDKKEKKDKTALADAVEQELTAKVLDGIDNAVAAEATADVEAEVMDVDVRPIGALVPFAQPLVEDKSAKKVLKSVKKGKLNLKLNPLSDDAHGASCLKPSQFHFYNLEFVYDSYCHV